MSLYNNCYKNGGVEICFGAKLKWWVRKEHGFDQQLSNGVGGVIMAKGMRWDP